MRTSDLKPYMPPVLRCEPHALFPKVIVIQALIVSSYTWHAIRRLSEEKLAELPLVSESTVIHEHPPVPTTDYIAGDSHYSGTCTTVWAI